MQRPTWVTIVAVMAWVFGGFGVMGGAQEIILPHMLDMQKEVLQSMNELVQQQQNQNNTSKDIVDPDNVREQGFNPFKLMDYFSQQMELPAWFRTYAPLFGTISILISMSYLLSGVLMFMLKPFAPMVFNFTLAISILWGIISAVIYGVSENIVLIMNVPASITSVIIDIVLMIVIALNSKEAFRTERSNVESL